MLVVVRRPSPALAPFVENLSYYEGVLPHLKERILPNGSMQLLINLDEDELRSYHGEDYSRVERINGACLSGAHAHHFGIDTAEQRAIAGVSFRPGGAYPFFTEPASAFAGDHVELDRLWGRDGAVLRERLLECREPEGRIRVLDALLLKRLARTLERDRAVDFALAAFARGVPVGKVVEKLGFTPRRFIKLFSEHVGLTPKSFARVQRFRSMLPLVGQLDWAELAVHCGYFDQAHLIHDFREFAGVTPTEYAPRSPGAYGHIALE
jgi:AraC-like DNA-binding protein